jgi:hypothetical protein
MDKQKISHDILNVLERLRIMHDLAFDGDYSTISKNELEEDLKQSLEELTDNFAQLLQ